MRRHWTETEDAAIVQWIAAHVSTAEIAEALGRTEAAVDIRVWKLRRAGQVPPAPSGVSRQQLARAEREPTPEPIGPEPIDRHTCELCGAAWTTHLRCAACTIGIGPNHIDAVAYRDGLCRACWEFRQRQAKRAA